MKNYIQKGDVLTLTAPYSLKGGEGFKVGNIFAIAAGDAEQGNQVEGALTGVFALVKQADSVCAIGDKLYWDDSNRRITATASGNKLVGVAVVAADNGTTTATLRLSASL